MADFTGENLAGSRFEKVDLTGALFHNVDLTGAVIRGALLVNVDISGEILHVRINGVDVVPLLEAELNRRYPDRAKMRPADADGYRQAWDILERLWQQTVARATRGRRASRCAGACRPSSSRSGSTVCTPNATSTCSLEQDDSARCFKKWYYACV